MFKTLHLLVVWATIFFMIGCSTIPENNDPILGIWKKTETIQVEGKGSQSVTEEWTFNDVYLGRYHKFENGKLTVTSDFSWELNKDGIYEMSYFADLGISPVSIVIDNKFAPEILSLLDGDIFAIKQ